MPHRVALFQQNPVWGATEAYLLDLLEGIDRSSFEPTLVCPSAAPLAPLRDGARAAGVAVVEFDADGASLARIRALRLAFREAEAELVHVNDPAPWGLLAAKAAGAKALVMTHHTPELRRAYGPRGRIMESLAFQLRPHVIFTSERDQTTGIASEGWPRTRSHVVPYGLHFERLALPAARARVRAELDLPPDVFAIGCAARLAPQKGHTYLFRALEDESLQRTPMRVLLFGDGPERDRMEAEVKERGLSDVVRFLDHRPNVLGLLVGLDAFVMPSLFEGFCYAVAEASAAGLPVVATMVGGVPEVIEDGSTGILVHPQDHEGLRTGIQALLADRERGRSMGAAGLRRVRERFTLERMVRETQAVYTRALGERGS